MRIKLTIEYDGTNYNGFQIQPGLKTIQSELETAIYKLTGEESRIAGSGRTDAGVHAIGQVAHFDTNKDLGSKFVGGLNFYLPPDIRIKNAEVVPDDFHARFNAKSKTYKYVMYQSRTESALLKNRATRVDELNVSLMQEAANVFVGKNDFAAFMSTGSDTLTTVRTVTAASVEASNMIIFSVTADGFLYNMVRKMVAALIEVGKGKLDITGLSKLLEPGAVFTPVAPPYGLYLYKVEYKQ